MKQYNRGVLLDLDGTCVWTNLVHVENLVGKTLAAFGKSRPPESNIRQFWFGRDRGAFVAKHFGLNPTEFWAVFNPLDTPEARLQHTWAYQDTKYLHALKRQGYKLGIVTGALPKVAEGEIRLFGNGLIDEVVVARPIHGVTEKPSPEGIQICLSKLNLDPRRTVYVGNADEDIGAARNAGVVDVLITRPENHVAEAHALKPKHIIKSLYELEGVLREVESH